jgi:WD40 repeat protein
MRRAIPLILCLLFTSERLRADELPEGAILRLGDARLRACGEVCELNFSTDGTELTSRVNVDGDRSRITLWNVQTGLATAVTTGPRPPGTRIRWSATDIPGTALGVSIGDDGFPVIRDYMMKKDVARLTGHFARVSAVAVSPDGKLIATASVDGLIRIWDAATYRPLHESAGHSAAVKSLELAPDGRTLLTFGGDRTVRIWDLATGRERRTFGVAPASSPVRPPAFTADGAAVFIPTPEGEIVRDLVTGLQITSPVERRPRSWFDRTPLPFAISSDGRTAAMARSDGTIDLYEAASLQVRRTLPGHIGACCDLLFTPDGTRLLSAGADHCVYVWPVRVRDVPLAAELKRETDAAALWSQMAYGRGVESYPAMARLAADPNGAVRMAKLCLKPGGAANPIADARAIELLESLGTAEARTLLRELADDDSHTARTRESRAALSRLGDVQYSRDGVRTIGGVKP